MKNYEEKIYKYYNSVSNKEESFDKSRTVFFQNIVHTYIPKDKKLSICELGAGSGQFQFVLKKEGYLNSFGIDASEEQVNLAKKFNLDVKKKSIIDFVNSSIKENKKYDLIIAIDVFEHFSKDSLFDLISKLYKLLSTNGIVISHQPNAVSPFFGNVRYGDYTHYNAFTSSSISQLFLSNNFNKVDSYEDKPLKHTLKSKIRYFLWELIVRKVYSFLILVETGTSHGKIFSQNFLSVAYKGN